MRFFERNAWKVFAALSAVIILFGFGDLTQGGETFRSGEAVMFRSLTGIGWAELLGTDPGASRMIDQQVRSGGVALLVAGLFSLAICLTALRRGERWAWYSMWIWPVWIGLVYVVFWISHPNLGEGIPVPLVSGTVVLVIVVVTLALSYRRYLRQP